MSISRTLTLSSLFSALILGLLLTSPARAGWDPNEKKELEAQAAETVRQFQSKDSSLKTFFDEATGYAVFPTVGKGGIGLGGAYGKGVVYAGGQVIGYTSLTQVTIGFQLGGQAYSELIFFKDQATLDRYKAEKVEFDAQVSAVAATLGAAANADYHSGVAVFTLTKGGLMYEASVGGQRFSFTAK